MLEDCCSEKQQHGNLLGTGRCFILVYSLWRDGASPGCLSSSGPAYLLTLGGLYSQTRGKIFLPGALGFLLFFLEDRKYQRKLQEKTKYVLDLL